MSPVLLTETRRFDACSLSGPISILQTLNRHPAIDPSASRLCAVCDVVIRRRSSDAYLRYRTMLKTQPPLIELLTTISPVKVLLEI